jgi:phosphoenolpyruvate synthase/pyruvate phosphate dikinase
MATINERKRAVGAMLAPGKVEIFEGQKLKELLDIFIEKQNTSITEFKGAPATRGYAKGKVRIIFVPHLVTDFKKGDILVAPETTPDFVPHMKSAAAIITDQGGITSHAAIISREMKIPCIVGTKIATRVLKDGDLVEVDAEKGIVRVLERK